MRHHHRLLTALLASSALIGVAQAQTLPSGGTVGAGGVTITTPAAGQMTINQSTGKAIVNWQGFSIGQGNSVEIRQPDANSVLLNRVTGNTSSTIAGSLTANGQVFLINPNGIAISKTGEVSAAGFVASSLDIADEDFLAGKLSFKGDGSSATVSNQGAVTVGRGGYAALLGGRVDNAGSIIAPLGKVAMGAGERATLDLSGDGFLQVAVPSTEQNAQPLIVQSGYIGADGGLVEIRTAAARDAARKTINLDGVIEARGVSGRSGAVVLDGGGGAVAISAGVDVSSQDGKGGAVTITGEAIALTGARIDATGQAGGGKVRIGGDFQGKGDLARAQTVTIDAASTVTADATDKGNGGRVIIWSDDLTDFSGKISARGGANGGDGGFSEVSGKRLLGFNGMVDLRAPKGKTGDLLLDPYNVTISNAASTGGFTATGDNSVINVTTLQNALATANVTISTGSGGTQDGDITIAANIAWSENTLTLDAYRSIAVNANLLASGTAGLAMNFNNGGSGGRITYAYGFSANFSGAQGAQSLTINGQPYTLIYDATQLQAITQTGLSANYALATSFNAVGTRNWTPYGFTPIGTVNGVIQGNGFTGTFDGLGNVVSNLFISSVPFNQTGLFGRVGTGGVVRNLGLSDVYANGTNNVGAIAGHVLGTIQNSWASGWVSGTTNVGGLVGVNGGVIEQSFSLVGVKARDAQNVGGLVGSNGYLIYDSYVMGAVLGGDKVGGIAGNNVGSISRSFFSGAVHGNSNIGPLVGVNGGGGTVTASLYDSTRSYFGGGLTMAQFQNGGGSLSTLGSAFGGGDNGLYPYLKAFFPNGAQAVSGTAYKDYGASPLISATPAPIYSKDPAFVALNAMGSYWGSVTTDRNGYFYFLVPVGVLAEGNAAMVYTSQTSGPDAPGTTNAIHLFTSTGAAAQTGLDLYGSTRTYQTSALLYSQTSIDTALLAQAIGGNSVTQAAYDGATNQRIVATGASYTIDTPLTIGVGGSVAVETIAAGSVLTLAQATTVGSTGALILKSAGTLRINGAITTSDKTIISLKSGGDLIVNAPITVFGGDQQGYVNPYFISLNSSSLVLDSAGAVRINAVVTNRGANAFTINHAAGDTNLSFSRSGRMDFVNAFGGEAIFLTDGGRTLTINGEAYSLVTSMAALAAMNGTSGRFALTRSLSGGFYANAVIANFAGKFDGLGHTINDLNINSSGAQLGLFGALASGSVVRNIGLNGGSITGGAGAGIGALAGSSQGSIANVWSSAMVIGGASRVGGLVGDLSGSIDNSYVTGLVQADGGFAGAVAGHNQGTIRNVLAAGLVLNTVGATGLVGQNDGLIDGALIAGYANAGASPLGAAGVNYGSINNLYFDSHTTGFTGGGTGLTTTQLQTDGLPAGLSADLWSGGSGGKYPYLSTFFPNGIDVISGFARRADGSAWQAMISLAANGALISRTGSGANGYYYAFGAPGTLSAGQGIVAFTDGGSDAISFRVGARTDLTTGLDLTEGWRRDNLGALSSTSAANALFTSTAQALTAGLAPANREITSTAAAFSVDQAISTTGSLALRAAGAVSQTQAISAGVLILEGSGAFTLTHAGNTVGSIAGTVGSLTFNNTGALTVGGLANGDGVIVDGLTATDDITLVTSGKLTIAAGGQVTGANAALSTGGVFENLRGSDAVTATTGRWLVYAASHLGNTFGNLDSGNSAIFGQSLATLSPGAVTQTGNRYIFASTPTVHLAGKALTKIYGEVLAPSGPASDWAVLVGAPEVAGAFRAATVDELFSSLTVSSSGATGTAGVGSYGLTITGLPASIAGYTLDPAVDGSLIVTPRAITVTADALSRIYGNANPLLTYTVGGLGLANGDSLAGALATNATATSSVGAWGISLGDLAGGANYDITFVGADLLITPRAITVTADALNRIYGDANPLLTYTVGGLGLANGDSLAGALVTSATTTSGVGAYGVSQGTVTNTSNGNYDITFVGADLTVTPRAITVTADALSRIYGNANPLLTYTIGGLGLVNGDSLAGALTTSAATTSGVGAYGITQGTVTNTTNANYDITFAGADLTVTPRTITVMADALSRIYGNANPTLTYLVGGLGLANGDSLTGALATSATTTSGIGAYGITQGDLAASANYDLTFVGADLTITPRAITVTADALSRIYGAANPTLSYTIGGLDLVNGDSLTGFLATTATTASGVGAYGITQGDLAASSNYDLTFSSADLTITPRAVTVTADALSRIYGNANPTLTYTVGGLGLVNGDSLDGDLATTATTASSVGAYGITQGTVTNANNANYDITFAGANLTLTPRAITITADALSRIYGNANPTLTYAVGGLGLVNGDELSGALATPATTASGVGIYGITIGDLDGGANYTISFTGADLTVTPRAITVTADALSRIYGAANPTLTYVVGGLGLANGDSLTGALATGASTSSGVGAYGITLGDLDGGANYTIAFNSADLTITPRAITVTADALSRIYGAANPTLSYTVGGLGLANGDSLTGALATGATTTSGIGAYGITQGDLAASSNYSLTFTGSNLTITPRAISVTADALSRIYGEANPTLTYLIGGMGLVNGDGLSGALATGATTSSGVGAYAITQGDLAASGDYSVTFTASNLTITPRAITVTADALSRIYGNANPALTYAIGGMGLVNGDALSGALATSATTGSGVGSYAITQGDLDAGGNYILSFTGSALAVTPRAITISADALSRIYGNANPTLTYTVGGMGLVNGDGLTGALATGAATTSDVGAYAITQGDLTAGGNYAISFSGADLTVTPRAITVTADALSRIYGNANPSLTYLVGGLGLVNGDSLAGALATSADATSSVGTYGITQGDLTASANYSLTFVGADLVVTPRAITVTADALNRIYGNANPTLTYTIGGMGLVNGDSLAGLLATSATTTSGVGSYAITQGSLDAGANYSLSFTGAGLTVTPRAITVTADALSRIYGDANPALTYSLGGLGLVNGDTLTGALATSATLGSSVGGYGVTQGTLAASGNYSLTFTGANLTVAPRAITVTADALSRTYGAANPALTYTVGGLGLVNGDSLSGDLATSATTTSGVGRYAIGQGTLANANYVISFAGADLAVTPRAITVTADALSRIYGSTNPLLTYTIGGQGLVNGDTLTGVLATAATNGSGVGAYGIGQGSLTASTNYAVTFNGATLTVTPRPITITAHDQSRVQGFANPTLTYSIAGMGLVNGDQLAGGLATDADQGSAAGPYLITQGSLSASANYTVTFQGGIMTVLLAPPSALNTASAIQPPFLAPYRPMVVDSRPEEIDGRAPGDVLTEDERLGPAAALLILSSR